MLLNGRWIKAARARDSPVSSPGLWLPDAAAPRRAGGCAG
jgi:hypothetical protein